MSGLPCVGKPGCRVPHPAKSSIWGIFFLFHFAILQCVLLRGVNITFYGFLLHCFTPSGSTQVNFVTL